MKVAIPGAIAAALAAIVLALAGGGEGDETAAPAAASLSDSQLAGQRIVSAFIGTSVPDELRRMVERGGIAGVVLFDGNAPSNSAVERLTDELQAIDRPAAVDEPLLVMVDQEGGLVKRLDAPPNASAEEMGAKGPRYARRQGAATGRALAELGVNVNLAPVLDVRRPGSAIDGEERSFGTSPRAVIETALPFAAAQRKAGVAGTAKHFPGFGAAAVNTDNAATEIGVSASELRKTDLPPFARFADRGGELVMSALAVYPALSDRPAAFSRAVIGGELRRRIGFEGVVATDSLNAAAAQAFGSPSKVAFAAAQAGNDLLLYTDLDTAQAAGRTLERRIGSGKLDRDDAVRAAGRVLELRESLR